MGDSSFLVLSSRPHVTSSGPRAKFGPKCNPNWPARLYQMCIRAGPRDYIKCALELARGLYHIFYF